MEKKGDIFVQMAIISDLLENLNMESEMTTVVFVVNEVEFERISKLVVKKTNKAETNKLEKSFSVTIGPITFIFNMNSV